MSTWADGLLCAFDTETTGVAVDEARIVSAYLGLVAENGPAKGRTWLADPGIEIPEEATAIHGITTEFARRQGRPSGEVIAELAEGIRAHLAGGTPVVVYNAAFDFSVLDRECRRHGLPSLEAVVGGPLQPIIDPFVLDKMVDRFRPGKRTLTATCAHYGVSLGQAHNAEVDALAAAAVARAIAQRYPEVAATPPSRLHQLQVAASAEQAASFQHYLRQRGSEAVIDGAWPLRP